MNRKFEFSQLYIGMGIILFFLFLSVFSYNQVSKAINNLRSDKYITNSSNSSLSGIINVPVNYYLTLEMNLKFAAEKYLEVVEYYNSILEYDRLDIILKDGIDNSECDGYIRIESNILVPYINCSNYQTEGY